MAKGGQSMVLGEKTECMNTANTAMLFNKLSNIQNNYNTLHKGLGLTLVTLHTKRKMMQWNWLDINQQNSVKPPSCSSTSSEN